MRTTDRIGFKLVIQEPDVAERTVIVCPRYEGLKLKWNKASGKVYHTMAIDGNVTFEGVDFNIVNACHLRTKFTLVIFYKGKGEVARCEFRKTDCRWDIDHRTCDIDVTVDDAYKKLEDGKDNEYNVVDFGLEKKILKYKTYPQRQLYAMGGSNAAIYGMESGSLVSTVERDVSFSTTDAKTDISRGWCFGDFALVMLAFNVTEEQSSEFADTYIVRGYAQANMIQNYSFVLAETTGYSVNHNYTVKMKIGYNSTPGIEGNALEVTVIANGVTKKAIQGGSFDYIVNGTTNLAFFDNSFTQQAFTANCRIMTVFSRLAFVSSSLGGSPILSGDMIENTNMRYVMSNERHSATVSPINVAVSLRTSDTATEYGKVEGTTKWYNTPDDTHKWLPMKKDAWFEGLSFWFGENYTTEYENTWYSSTVTCQDFYFLGDVIKAVLNKIDSRIVFDADIAHSQFLFGDINPVSGNSQRPMYISQKSNILNLGYDYPAWQAPITWGKIETLLKNAFGCYCSMYDDNGTRHLRIEHLVYYMNRGYGSQTVHTADIDLTQIYHAGTPYSYADKTNNWEWDTDGSGIYSSANRYEYGWMDTQSVIFDGYPIVVPTEYRLFDSEKAEERKVDWFSSDIDFLTAVKAECSSDGFVIVMESMNENGWIMTGDPYHSPQRYRGQNYALAMDYLEEEFLCRGIYAERVQIGDNPSQPNTVTVRMRKSDVIFALPDREWCDAEYIIRTSAGNATIDTLTLDLHSEQWSATVRYDNE